MQPDNKKLNNPLRTPNSAEVNPKYRSAIADAVDSMKGKEFPPCADMYGTHNLPQDRTVVINRDNMRDMTAPENTNQEALKKVREQEKKSHPYSDQLRNGDYPFH